MLGRKGIFLIIALQLIVTVAANACPYCAYSPHNWGFCQDGRSTGVWLCEGTVVDSWTGRTGCSVCGTCDWNDPSRNHACVSQGDGDCGLLTPCDQTLKGTGLSGAWCGTPSRITNGNDLNWIDARVDQVVIF